MPSVGFAGDTPPQGIQCIRVLGDQWPPGILPTGDVRKFGNLRENRAFAAIAVVTQEGGVREAKSGRLQICALSRRVWPSR